MAFILTLKVFIQPLFTAEEDTILISMANSSKQPKGFYNISCPVHSTGGTQHHYYTMSSEFSYYKNVFVLGFLYFRKIAISNTAQRAHTKLLYVLYRINWKECAAFCRSTPGCRFWTYRTGTWYSSDFLLSYVYIDKDLR